MQARVRRGSPYPPRSFCPGIRSSDPSRHLVLTGSRPALVRRRTPPLLERTDMNSELRPDQARALASLRASLAAGHSRPLVQAPTGWGKTLLATAIAEEALSGGQRIV